MAEKNGVIPPSIYVKVEKYLYGLKEETLKHVIRCLLFDPGGRPHILKAVDEFNEMFTHKGSYEDVRNLQKP